jgi:hypothetical protein
MHAEPAVIGAAVAAIINLAVLLWLGEELTAEQQGAIITVVTVIAGLFVRSQVTPSVSEPPAGDVDRERVGA